MAIKDIDSMYILLWFLIVLVFVFVLAEPVSQRNGPDWASVA